MLADRVSLDRSMVIAVFWVIKKFDLIVIKFAGIVGHKEIWSDCD